MKRANRQCQGRDSRGKFNGICSAKVRKDDGKHLRCFCMDGAGPWWVSSDMAHTVPPWGSSGCSRR